MTLTLTLTQPITPSMGRHADELEMGCMDKTFPKGFVFRCTAIFGIAINIVLFIIGFVITAYGARLAVQERKQVLISRFLNPRNPQSDTPNS